MGHDMAKEAEMSAKPTQRLVREGEFVAEVDVNLVESDDGWAPHLSLEDAYKLDDVHAALRTGDLKAASRLAARVYRLTPVEA
jgi:hypothetical protein